MLNHFGLLVSDVMRIYDYCLRYRHNHFPFYQLPNSNFSIHRMLFSREKLLVKLWHQVYLLLYKNTKNTLLQFSFIYFIYYFGPIYQSKTIKFNLPRKRWGIDNPMFAMGCKDLLFVCMRCQQGVAWFSYWIDNLDS